MKQRCPRCQHLRKPDDQGPDWQCPACGIAYAKAYAHAPEPTTSTRSLRRPAVSQGGDGLLGSWVFKALIAIAVVVMVSMSSGHRWWNVPQRTAPGPSSSPTTTDIAIYTTSTCVYCHEAKAYMDQRRIAYTEYDVEHDLDRRREFYALGGQGTPLIVVGDEVVHGFEASMLQQAIDRHQRR